MVVGQGWQGTTNTANHSLPRSAHMACGQGIEAPLDVALLKMFVNLVLIPGINSLTKHAFSSNWIGSGDVLHRASTSNKTTNCINQGVSKLISCYLHMHRPCSQCKWTGICSVLLHCGVDEPLRVRNSPLLHAQRVGNQAANANLASLPSAAFQALLF